MYLHRRSCKAGSKTALNYSMRRFLMSGFLAVVGLLLAGTVAAFFRFVSLWTVLTAALVFLGMLLTFLMGAYVGFDHAVATRTAKELAGVLTGPGPAVSLRDNEARQPELLASRR
jgi:hypothetical protein